MDFHGGNVGVAVTVKEYLAFSNPAQKRVVWCNDAEKLERTCLLASIQYGRHGGVLCLKPLSHLNELLKIAPWGSSAASGKLQDLAANIFHDFFEKHATLPPLKLLEIRRRKLGEFLHEVSKFIAASTHVQKSASGPAGPYGKNVTGSCSRSDELWA